MSPAGDYNPLFERFVKENASLEDLRAHLDDTPLGRPQA